MLRFNADWYRWLVALMLGLWALTAQAQEFRYNYISLDTAPAGYAFFDPAAIANNGRVYGTAYDDSAFLPNVAVYARGAVTVLQPGIVYAANERGLIGGSVLTDVDNFIEQATLFRGSKMALIPRQPDEVTSRVVQLTDSGTALVVSTDANFDTTYVLYKNGKVTPLDFGLDNVSGVDINNKGILSGITDAFGAKPRGFRLDPRTGKATLLPPLPTEPNSWALDINNPGAVLGYSFVFGGIERIGTWDNRARFKTYFVEGTPEFPTISNNLLFNDRNLIVITNTSDASDRMSYLVPRQGVRLELTALVKGEPAERGALWQIVDINNRGEMIGFGLPGNLFLLQRGGGGRR